MKLQILSATGLVRSSYKCYKAMGEIRNSSTWHNSFYKASQHGILLHDYYYSADNFFEIFLNN